MTDASSEDWDPEAYGRFRGLRLRPARDLLARVGAVPAGTVVDLGCGDGAALDDLRAAFAGRRVVGVDASEAMLARAEGYDRLIRADIADWTPDKSLGGDAEGGAPALIFSNAALHWLGGHDRLMPRLLGYLVPGGVLAVQMPRQYMAPSHRFLRDFAQEMAPDRFDFTGWEPPVLTALDYVERLAPLCTDLDAWETEYVQRLSPSDMAHPVRLFTEATVMRPIMARLAPDEQAALIARYDAALEAAYPRLPDGSVLFPFRRVFVVARR